VSLPITTEYPIAPSPNDSKLRRFLPAHPGYYEGILVQSARQFASLAMCTALAIALGGGHYTVAALAAIPFVARMAHLVVPRLVLRYTSWTVARGAFWLERIGFLAAAAAAIVRPGDATVALFLASLALAYLGQAVYDAAMSALHNEVSQPGAYGEYMSQKTRWASIAGLALGVAGAFAVDSVEHLGVPTHVSRALAIATGIAIHLLIARPFAEMGKIARRRAHRPSRQLVAVPGRSLTWPGTQEDWAVIQLALAWGFTYGFAARQAEAMAMRELGISVGTITLLNAALVGAGVLGARTWGRLGDRFGGKGLMAFAMAAFAFDPVWTLLAMHVSTWAFLPAYLIWGVFMTGWNIAQSLALVRPIGHPADRIRLITMYNVAYGLAAGIAPLIGGALLTWMDARVSTRASFTALFAVTIALRLATIPVLLRLPAANAATPGHISTVYLRLVKQQTLRSTRRVSTVMRTPVSALYRRVASGS
jgi:hypothetical protein